MVAYVTATPNPVVFSWPDVQQQRARDVEVAWDTGDKKPGRVTIVVDGVARPPVPAAGAASSTTRFQLGLGQSASAELKSLDGRVSYGLTTVTTKKDALAAYMTDPDRTFIQKLIVRVGIESLTVRFDTPDDAFGFLLVRRRDTGVAVTAELEPHFSRQHRLSVPNLPQETQFDLSISALRRNAQGGVTLGSGAKNPTEVVVVTTGSRTVTAFFDSIWMRNDSDSGGSGEIHVALSAGGVAPPGQFGQVYFDDRDFGDGGVREINQSIVGVRAPRQIWLRADGYDDDGGPFTGVGVGGFVQGMTPPGTHGAEYSGLARAEVTSWLDTDDQASDRRVPVMLETGTFALAFTVFAAVRVERRLGTVTFLEGGIRPERPRGPFVRRRDSTKVESLRRPRFPVARGDVRVSLLPPAGALAVWRSTGTAERGGQVVELDLVPTVAAVIEDAAGRVWVFAADEEARVSVRAVDSDPPAPAEPLPVRAIGLAAAAPGDRVVLCTVDPDGVLSVLDLADGRPARDPLPIGERMVGQPTTLTAESGGVAVFARRADGQVVHRMLRPGGEPGDERWDELGAAPDGELVAEWVDDGEGLLLRAVAADHSEAVLYWPGYPEHGAATEWAAVPAP